MFLSGVITKFGG